MAGDWTPPRAGGGGGAGDGAGECRGAAPPRVARAAAAGAAAPPITDDVFVASGGFPGPLRGAAALRAASAAQRATRRNPSRTETVERLEVAEAGDLAYVYGTQRLEWDTPEGEHRTVDAAYLQVWRQDAGEWRLAARIAHPIAPDA